MESPRYLLVPAILVLLSGCATKSLVVSKRADSKRDLEGIVYSLPKQLVKVAYNRKAIDPTKVSEEIDSIKKSLQKKISNEKEVKRRLSRNDLEEDKRTELKNKLEDIETTKLGLTRNLYARTSAFAAAIMKCAPSLESTKNAADSALSEFSESPCKINAFMERTIEFADAIIECDQSLQPDGAYSEELIITEEEPIPDTDYTFYTEINHQITSSDTLEISIKDGLLDGAVGQSEDKTGEVAVSLIGGLSGIIHLPMPPAQSLTSFKSLLDRDVAEQPQKCEKKSEISIIQIIDPGDSQDVCNLNRQLYAGCIGLAVTEADKNRMKEQKKLLTEREHKSKDGLIYRQPGVVTLEVKEATEASPPECGNGGRSGETVQFVRLSLAQGGKIGVLPFPKRNFSNNEYDVSFSNGMLSRSKTVQPSEVLRVVNIIPNALKAMFAIPTELLQLKVDYSSREKELLELKKAMLEAQAEIIKKQAEIENLKKENNSE